MQSLAKQPMMGAYATGSRYLVNTTTIVGIVLMLPLAYGALFQARPREWVIAHASIAMLEIAGFIAGLILVLLGVWQ